MHGNKGREDTDECVRRDNVVVVRESGDGKKYERRAAPHGSGGRDRERARKVGAHTLGLTLEPTTTSNRPRMAMTARLPVMCSTGVTSEK